jgi:hypothetical protein
MIIVFTLIGILVGLEHEIAEEGPAHHRAVGIYGRGGFVEDEADARAGATDLDITPRVKPGTQNVSRE